MPATPAWFGAAEAFLNRGLDSSAEAAALARRLDGRALRLEIHGLATMRLCAVRGRLALTADGPVDATIEGSPLALYQLASADAPRGTQPRERRTAQIRGDAEVANQFRRLIGLARPDLEEELSRLVGDLPARRLSRLAEVFIGWARHAARTAGANVAEYLEEESRDLVGRTEVEEFLRGVDDVRDAAERLAARLARLEQRPPRSP